MLDHALADPNPIAAHPCYTGFFVRFNKQEFFEAHEVLEELWLQVRNTADGDFFKGLIQVAGAFVHVQKKRKGPALALFSLARLNLSKYPGVHQGFDVARALDLISRWESIIRQEQETVPELERFSPRLSLS